MAESSASYWACPQCHSEIPSVSRGMSATYPLSVATRIVHGSASLEEYDDACAQCGLPFTLTDDNRFEYPYRQMLAKFSTRRFLRWSAAQNNGFVSYAMMRGSSCSIEGREDVRLFSDFITTRVGAEPEVILDFGCGPLARPGYLPTAPKATFIGVDPFESDWDGSFIQGVGEFLPIRTASVDVVTAATALDHALDVGQTLRELARVTRSGGSLFVWDHTFPPRFRRFAEAVYGVLFARKPFGQRVANARWSFLPERVRVYDNGIVLWTPKGYADPFHEPQSRRPSWPRKLRKAIEDAGFVYQAEDQKNGFSHYLRA